MIKYDRKRRDEFLKCSHTDMKYAGEVDTTISYDEIQRCYKCGAFIPYNFGYCNHNLNFPIIEYGERYVFAPWVETYQCGDCGTFWGLDSIFIETQEEIDKFKQKHNKALDICDKILDKMPDAKRILNKSPFDIGEEYNVISSLYSGYSIFASIDYRLLPYRTMLKYIEQKLLSEFKEAGIFLDIYDDNNICDADIIYYGIYFDDSGHEGDSIRRYYCDKQEY